jgi:hypothetical protein
MVKIKACLVRHLSPALFLSHCLIAACLLLPGRCISQQAAEQATPAAATDPTTVEPVDPAIAPAPTGTAGGQMAPMAGGTGGAGAANTGSTTGGQPILC